MTEFSAPFINPFLFLNLIIYTLYSFVKMSKIYETILVQYVESRISN